MTKLGRYQDTAGSNADRGESSPTPNARPDQRPKRTSTAKVKAWKRDARANRVPPRHGSAYIYDAYGCRCPLCTAANTEKQAQRRRRIG